MAKTTNIGEHLDFFLTLEDFQKLLERIGYHIDDTGVLIDKKTGLPVKSIKGKEVNIKEDDGLTLIIGSHIFAKNVAELSHFLVKKGLLRYKEK